MITNTFLLDQSVLIKIIKEIFDDDLNHSEEEIMERIKELKEIEWIYEDLSK